MTVTLEDIAAKAGVSTAVVSQILRNHPNAKRFRSETRNRVLQVAEELQYRPNFFASQFHKQNRKMVMLCVANLDDFYFSSIAQAFEAEMARQGYNVLLSSLKDKDDVGYFDGILGSHGVLALAVVGMQSRSALPDDVLVDIAGRGVKVVTIGRHIESDRICQVIYDNKQGVHLAIDHLLEQKPEQLWLFGHKLTRNDELIDPLGRIDEALQYLSQVRPSLKKRILDLGDRPLVEAGNIVSETLVSRGKPDAVFCSTDWLAWETIHSLRESGLTVGKDVMVVGFNNDMLSRYIQPALTSVDIPYEDLGIQGARLLLEAYEERCQIGKKIWLPTDLVIRSSSVAVPE